jgi:hypothetical protein
VVDALLPGPQHREDPDLRGKLCDGPCIRARNARNPSIPGDLSGLCSFVVLVFTLSDTPPDRIHTENLICQLPGRKPPA